jgi:hypothetical protein
MLADSAQAVNGKLYVLGGGWSNQWGMAPFAIAGKVEVPWNQATSPHTFRLELLDADGQLVDAPTAEGNEPLVIEDKFSTGVPPGATPGYPTDFVLAINFAPLPLDEGRYEWRFTIDGNAEEAMSLGFNRLAPPQAQAA